MLFDLPHLPSDMVPRSPNHVETTYNGGHGGLKPENHIPLPTLGPPESFASSPHRSVRRAGRGGGTDLTPFGAQSFRSAANFPIVPRTPRKASPAIHVTLNTPFLPKPCVSHSKSSRSTQPHTAKAEDQAAVRPARRHQHACGVREGNDRLVQVLSRCHVQARSS